MEESKDSTRLNHRQAHNKIIFFMRIIGLWVSDNASNSIFSALYQIYNKLVVINMSLLALAVLNDLCFNCHDLITFTNDGCMFSGMVMITFKVVIFQLRAKRIRAISEKIHTPVDAFDRSTDPGVRAVVQSYMLYEKMFLNGFWIMGVFLSVAMMLAPVEEEGDLPIRAVYPFDVKTFPMHQIIFCTQAWSVSAGLVAINGMDQMVMGLFDWINAQLIVLGANYENCAETKSASANTTSESLLATNAVMSFMPSVKAGYPRNDIKSFIICSDEQARAINENDTFIVRFKTCIEHHQRLISVVDELNEIFSSSLFVQLFTSFTMICLAGFQTVLGANDFTSFVKFSLYLNAAISQLACWCWVGTMLMHHSAAIAASQWLSAWEDYLTPELTSLMIISMSLSHRALGLQAGNFFTISIQTFILIVRNCYSFFALLMEMTSRD